MDNELYLKDREEFIKTLDGKSTFEDVYLTYHKLLNKQRELLKKEEDSKIFWFGEFKKQEEEIKKLKEELENFKNANKKKRKVKKGVKLTKNQIEFIKELTYKYNQTKKQILIFFNEKYTNRKEPLTISQLKKIMIDNNIVKPKISSKTENEEKEKMEEF